MTEEIKPNRVETVVRLRHYPYKDGPLRRHLSDKSPSPEDGFQLTARQQGITHDDFWIVWLTHKSGTLPEKSDCIIFEHEAEMREFLEKHPLGSTLPSMEDILDDGGFARKLGEVIFGENSFGRSMLSAGDENAFLTLDVLNSAGLTDGLGLNAKVTDYLGAKRLDELKVMHGENWDAAAIMEYCWYNLPKSSSAYVAAHQHYSYYITRDDFSAGYLLRDLEVLAYGVEESAQRAQEYSSRQAMRSAKGGAAQSQKAAERRKELFKILLSRASDWVWKSEREQLRFAKNLMKLADEERPDPLFTQSGKLLSDAWTQQAISDLRLSGELEKRLS